MRKLWVFLAILFVSVMSSACINNFAIQELNTKAKEYLDKGDYDEAIKRLESSVDLDGEVFETRYNLGVAYVNKEEFQNAVKELNEAIRLNPENPDVYYTLGVALEGEGYKKVNEKEQVEDGSLGEDDEKSLFKTKKEAEYTISKLKESVDAYKKYLETAKVADDSDKVNEHIKELQQDIETYSGIEFQEFGTAEVSEKSIENKAQ